MIQKSLLFVIIFAFFIVKAIYAADFRSEYEMEYFISESSLADTYVKASYVIRLTNLQPDLYVSKFSLFFPKSFGVGNIKVNDEAGPIQPSLSEKERLVEVILPFNSPRVGMNETNTLYIDFLQKNVFRAKGEVWELLIPTIETKDMTLKKITVNLPPGKNRKLSLGKPSPSYITFDKVIWNNPNVKTIYAVFGERQNYQLSLTYTLINPKIQRVYTDIALPPDTLYQQTVIDKVHPQPDLLYSDIDGNFMARYYLQPKETKVIQYKGYVEVFTQPRTDYMDFVKTQFTTQKTSLFNLQKLWNLDSAPIKSKRIKDMYDYVIDTLSYNFNRIIEGNSRLGSQDALLYPDQAVCTEYSDVFVAVARKNGFYVREIQGYGFANEQEIRPVSTYSDILHSWVEYYDETRQIWIPIDPTWEDTAGIDYFSSFDLNHIAFVIHGNKADYPYPAGSYKQDKTAKDIFVNPISRVPIEKKTNLKADISSTFLPSSKQNEFTVTIQVYNTGNVSIWNKDISVSVQNASINLPNLSVTHLYPGERKEYTVSIIPKHGLFVQKVAVKVQYENSIIGERELSFPAFLTYIPKYLLIPAALVVVGLLIVIIAIKRFTKHD